MIEAWLATAVFGALALLWVILPSRLIRREEGVRTPANGATLRAAERLPAGVPAITPPSHSGAVPRESSGPGRLMRYMGRTEGEAPVPRFLYVADLAGLNGWGEVTVPIFRETAAGPDVRRKETYRAEIAGTVLEAGNVATLHDRLDGAVQRLMQTRHLPRLWFGLPSGAAVPVNRHGEGYEARVAGGPVITARTLALLRERFTSYALSVGMLGAEEGITLMRLGPDFQRDAPLAVLVGPQMWVPIFQRSGMLEGEGAALPPGAGPFRAPADLLRLVRELAGTRITPDGSWAQIRLTDVPAEAWASIVPELGPLPRRLRWLPRDGDLSFAPVFAWEDVLVCAQGTDSLTVYVAPTDWELADRLAADLERTARIAHRDDVRIEWINDREEVSRR